MRKIIFTTFAAVALAAVSANAEMAMKETTTTTSYSGTVSSLSPQSSTMIIKSESSTPNTYRYTEKTSWVDSAGATVSREMVQNQPVTVFYEKQGDAMVVTKVQTQKTVPMLEKKTTTTTTTEAVE